MLRTFILISAHCALWNENVYFYLIFCIYFNSPFDEFPKIAIHTHFKNFTNSIFIYFFNFDSFSLTSCFRNARKFEFGAFTVDNISYFQNFTYRKTAKMSDDENAPPPTSASKKAKKVSTPNSIRASLSSPLQALRAFTSLSNRGSVKSPVSKSSPLGKFFSSKVRWKSHLGPPS